MRKRLPILLVVVMALILPFTVASAQFANPWVTSYMLQNLSSTPANVVVDYFDQNGAAVTAASKSLSIPGNAAVTVVQYTDDPNLPSGRFSAVVSSDQEVAAIVNEQTAPTGLGYMSSQPPFGSYSGAKSGGANLSAPEVMYNWYGYYTQMYIQNTSSTADAHVTITYIPGSIGGVATGASGVKDQNITIKPNSTYMSDQKAKSSLGAPSGTYVGRFNGSAIISSSDQLVVGIVNELNDGAVKLFSYNAFAGGSNSVSCPSILRQHYGWYTSLAIANPDVDPTHVAQVTVTYKADNAYSLPSNLRGTTVVKTFSVPGGAGVLRYDGPGSGADKSDLTTFTRFFGDVLITSTGYPIVAKVNQENTGGNAEAYNCIDTGTATTKIAVPMIQAKFYNFYTSLTIKNLDPTNAADVTITYKSDGTYSSPTNTTHVATHQIVAGGQFNSWEGGSGGDVFSSGKFTRFNGSAVITSNRPIIAIVNEEKGGVSGADYGYSFNVINTAP